MSAFSKHLIRKMIHMFESFKLLVCYFHHLKLPSYFSLLLQNPSPQSQHPELVNEEKEENSNIFSSHPQATIRREMSLISKIGKHDVWPMFSSLRSQPSFLPPSISGLCPQDPAQQVCVHPTWSGASLFSTDPLGDQNAKQKECSLQWPKFRRGF